MSERRRRLPCDVDALKLEDKQLEPCSSQCLCSLGWVADESVQPSISQPRNHRQISVKPSWLPSTAEFINFLKFTSLSLK